MTRILRIDSSVNLDGSVTRMLGDRIVARFDDARVTHRDLARDPLPQITETWAEARATPAEKRTEEQAAALDLSDRLIAELEEADVIVIGAPVYNFSIPAALKAWIDLVARQRVTFRYTEDGPVGLLADRPVYVAMASGGTEMGSSKDFHSDFLRFFLGFIGLKDVTFIAADRLSKDREGTIARAKAQIDALDI